MLYQAFRFGNERVQAVVYTDPDTGQRYVPFQNILDSFPDVNKVLLDGATVPFLTDAFVRKYEPPRIPFYPGETLELVTAASASPSFASIEGISATVASPPPIPPRPPSESTTYSTQYLLVGYHNNDSQDDQQREDQHPLQPPLQHTRGHHYNNRHPYNLVTEYYPGQLTFRFEESLGARLMLFSIVVALVFASQISSLSSKVLDGYMGERDDLKQRIIYWATFCSIVHSLMLFFLARWFTKDLVWHLDARDMQHLWGLAPSIASILVVFRVRALSIVAFAIILTLIAVFAMVIQLWLTSATFILKDTFHAPPSNNITLMDVPIANDTVQWGFQNGNIFDSFVQQGSIGNLGKLQLTPYMEGYLWMPTLETEKPTDVYVKNVLGTKIIPMCRQLTNTEVGVPAYKESIIFSRNRTVRLGPYNATIPSFRGLYQYWGFFARAATTVDNAVSTVQIYNILANSRREFGQPTFEFMIANTTTFVYAVECNVTVETWNITGYMRSYSSQRLYNVESAYSTFLGSSNYIWWTLRGLDRWTKTELAGRLDNVGSGLHSMLWMWMQGRKYTDMNHEPPLKEILIADWTKQKIVEIIAATFTPGAAAVVPRRANGAALMETSVIRVSVPKLIGGLMFQLTYVALAVGFYVFKRRSKIYRSDDITHLLKKDVVGTGRPHQQYPIS